MKRSMSTNEMINDERKHDEDSSRKMKRKMTVPWKLLDDEDEGEEDEDEEGEEQDPRKEENGGGRKEKDAKGRPTRLLLSLRAWGASSKADARAKARAISKRNKAKKSKKKT